MYNNNQPNNLTAQRPTPDIYAILNSTEDPPIEEPIDTDALVKDIFSTNYSSSIYLPCTEFNFNHDLINFDITSPYTHPLTPASLPPPPTPIPSAPSVPFQNYQQDTSYLLDRRHSHSTSFNFSPPPTHLSQLNQQRASMPNIFQTRIPAPLTPILRSQPQAWTSSSTHPYQRRRTTTDLTSKRPYQDIPPSNRRASMATASDICTWNRMVNTRNRPQLDDYPVITDSDLEAAKRDPNAIPRRQKTRYEQDEYTPKWVRYTGQLKEGYCDTCQPKGKWLQLKNSAYWYHKQFFHGISSVSGKEFQGPVEKRAGEHDTIEGLCHQCKTFVPICNSKRKNSVLWYRHAHKCHIYDKPKSKTNGKKSSVTPSPTSHQFRENGFKQIH